MAWVGGSMSSALLVVKMTVHRSSWVILLVVGRMRGEVMQVTTDKAPMRLVRILRAKRTMLLVLDRWHFCGVGNQQLPPPLVCASERPRAPPPQPQRTSAMCANIMNQKILALCHAAVGMEMPVLIHPAAAVPRKQIAVGIVNGKLISANLQSSKHVPMKEKQGQMCVQRAVRLWIIVSSVSLQLVCGKKTTVKIHGPQVREHDHRAASGTESSMSNATNLNPVRSIQMELTK